MKNKFPLLTRQKPPAISTVLKLPYSLFLLSYSLFFTSCSVSKQIHTQAKQLLLEDAAIKQGHIGISIFDPSTGKYVYNHNADKYFIPASNTKLFSWYAGMKYLGDSLVGIRYSETGDTITIYPTGDPTFLESGYDKQPVLSFLRAVKKKINLQLNPKDNFEPFGYGWAWDDYESSYMAERSKMPSYGNVATFRFHDGKLTSVPPVFAETLYMAIPGDQKFELHRSQYSNKFHLSKAKTVFSSQQIPFKPDVTDITMQAVYSAQEHPVVKLTVATKVSPNAYTIFSQPSDSLFKPMMHRSDNFFAEQTLLMASNEYLGYMSDRAMIDTILKTGLKDLPQQPRWVDGSGLSRYNLFTPQDFVFLLDKIKKEYNWDRIKNTLPTGGEGTLSSYYKNEAGLIYAKTGTLSNNCALSGYLITKKNKMLIFSVLVNNYPTSATPVRRAVEKFIKSLREKY